MAEQRPETKGRSDAGSSPALSPQQKSKLTNDIISNYLRKKLIELVEKDLVFHRWCPPAGHTYTYWQLRRLRVWWWWNRLRYQLGHWISGPCERDDD